MKTVSCTKPKFLTIHFLRIFYEIIISFLPMQQVVISILFAVLTRVLAQGPVSQSDVYFAQDGVDVMYSINHRPMFGIPQAGVPVNRVPFILPQAPELGRLPGLNVPNLIMNDAVNIPRLYQNPFGYRAVDSPFFNRVNPYGNQSSDFFRSRMVPFSPIFNNARFNDASLAEASLIGLPLSYRPSPFSGTPFLDQSYMRNSYRRFSPSFELPNAPNPMTPWNFQGFNPYGLNF